MEGSSRKGLKICCGVSIGAVLLVVILIVAIGVIANTTDTEPVAKRTSEPTATRGTGLSNAEIVDQIKIYPEVRDAAITREGNQVSLVLIVGAATSIARAQELGENFVRMYKTFSDDTAPGSSIGTGKYDYVIGVYTPSEKTIVIGAKSRVASRISW